MQARLILEMPNLLQESPNKPPPAAAPAAASPAPHKVEEASQSAPEQQQRVSLDENETESPQVP